MPAGIRITYRHILGCLTGECPSHSATIRTSADVETVIRSLTEQHSDFPIEIEGVEDLSMEESRRR
jgi:hypothetical protein